MHWIVGILFLAALIGSYSGGWHRGRNGLGLWPFTAGKDGIHRQPLILFALLLTAALVACSTEHYAQPEKPADTTAARADSNHHDRGHGDKHQDHDQDHEKKP